MEIADSLEKGDNYISEKWLNLPDLVVVLFMKLWPEVTLKWDKYIFFSARDYTFHSS